MLRLSKKRSAMLNQHKKAKIIPTLFNRIYQGTSQGSTHERVTRESALPLAREVLT